MGSCNSSPSRHACKPNPIRQRQEHMNDKVLATEGKQEARDRATTTSITASGDSTCITASGTTRSAAGCCEAHYNEAVHHLEQPGEDSHGHFPMTRYIGIESVTQAIDVQEVGYNQNNQQPQLLGYGETAKQQNVFPSRLPHNSVQS